MILDHRTARQFRTEIPNGNQMPGEVAAIDRGNIFRLQRAQVLGAIPVVEMAAMAFEAVHRGESDLQPVDGFGQADPAEISRGCHGQQIEPDIGGRRAMRDDWIRILLEIVGR